MASSACRRVIHRHALCSFTLAAWSSAAVGTQLVDARGEALWVCGDTYKAGFDRGGATFVPFLGSKAERNRPLHLELASVRAGGRELAFESGVAPQLGEARVSFERGALTEIYRLSSSSIELAFQLDRIPAPGDLELRVAIESELERWGDSSGLVFTSPDGGIHVGEATIFDGAGRSAPVAMNLDGEAWTLRVDANFLADAVAPLLIDPLFTTFSVDESPVSDRDPDVAYDASLGYQVVVWERVFSADDKDVYGQVLDASGTTLRKFLVFGSPEDELRGRVAGFEALDRFIVVAVTPQDQGHGRIIDVSGHGPLLGPVASYSTRIHDHELGGDAGETGPFRCALILDTVTPGQCPTPDIVALFLGPDGDVVLQSTIMGDCEYVWDMPQISKRNVPVGAGTDRQWGCLYRADHIFINRFDARYAWLRSSGQVQHVGWINHIEWPCAVTVEPPATLVSFCRKDADIWAQVGLGALTFIEHASDLAADHDGASVVAVYIDPSEGVRASTYDVVGNTLVPTESGVALSQATGLCSRPSIVATSGAGIVSQRNLCVWDRRLFPTPIAPFDVQGAVYYSSGPGARYCTAAPNSVGPGAHIYASGSISIAADQFELLATGCPPTEVGIFILGVDQIEIPFGNGFLCIGGASRRITPAVTTNGAGSASLLLDFDLPYGDIVQPGAPGTNYQFFYRDPSGAPTLFNLSDARHVSHTP